MKSGATASGDVAPLRTLQTTGFSNPWGLLIDTVNNEIAVANNGGLLSVYSRTGNGNIAPLCADGFRQRQSAEVHWRPQ